MKFLDLFAGIGGFRLGLEQAGHECKGFVEWDEYARESYRAIHDTDGEWTAWDITQVDEKDLDRLKAQDIDLIAGGFPCQAFSNNGKRQGFDDTRGTLFFEVARIARYLKPKYLLLENVKGLLFHDKGNTIDTIAMTLSSLGYSIDLNVLDAEDFGLPQTRERAFIVAARNDIVKREPWEIKGKKLIDKAKRRIQGMGAATFRFDWPQPTGRELNLMDLLEPEAPESFFLTDERVRLYMPDRLPEGIQMNIFDFLNEGPIPVITKGKGRVSFIVEKVENFTFVSRKKAAVLDDEGKVVATMEGNATTFFLANYEAGIPIREATRKGYAMAREGDAVNLQFPKSTTRRGRVGRGKAHTLEARKANQAVVLWDAERKRYVIRKLLPIECWRLQGFPDDAFHKAAAKNSNTQLYKQAGNSVAVNVVREIGKRLKG